MQLCRCGAIVKEVPNLTGTYLDPVQGTLRVTGVSPADYPSVLDIFPEGVYHLYDYQFFNATSRLMSKNGSVIF